MLATIGFMFVVTGVQYWLANYLEQVLQVDKEVRQVYIPITGISAPVLGVIVGNFVMTYSGGYESISLLSWIQSVAFVSILIVIPAPFCNEIISFGILLWFVLFFGGWLLPIIIGFQLRSVDENLRGSANSLS